MTARDAGPQAAQDNAINIAALFEPLALGSIELRNRIVMAPMTRYFSPDGIPGGDVVRYYERRAADVGLIITEGTFVSHPTAGYCSTVPCFYGAEALAGWAEVLRAVHAAGGRIMPQLWHAGSQGQPGDVPDPDLPPLSASGLIGPGQPGGAAMTIGQIEDVIEAFAACAASAHQLGFDGIELHAAHGYLIDSFLWHGTNQRTDEYGGDIRRRARFAEEIIRECRRRTAPDFPILFRFSQWKNVDYQARLADTPEELGQLLQPLAEAGVDLFDCSTRRFWEPAFEGSPRTLAGWTRVLTGKPVMAVGSVGLSNDLFGSLSTDGDTPVSMNIETAAALVDSGEADLIAVGRGLLADPEWTVKVREGRFGDIADFRREALADLF